MCKSDKVFAGGVSRGGNAHGTLMAREFYLRF
jgi:hypothetical protein